MGGKSRKSGGVSKKLIEALKSGKYSETKKPCGGKSKNENNHCFYHKSKFSTCSLQHYHWADHENKQHCPP